MTRRSIVAAAFVVGLMLGLAATARANWNKVAAIHRPRYTEMDTGTPVYLTTAGAAETHTTLSEKGACVVFDCGAQDAAFLTSPSSAVVTATSSTGNNIYAKQVVRMCLAANKDYLSIWTKAATTCTVAELSPP